MVLLPEAERPVNQTVAPCCPRSWARSSCVTAPGWKVMLVALVAVIVFSGNAGEGIGLKLDAIMALLAHACFSRSEEAGWT